MNIDELYKLSSDDVDKGSEVLRDAFADYPTFARLIPDKKERERKLKYLMAFFIKSGLLYGEVYAPTKSIEGVAVWFESTKIDSSIRGLIKAGLLRLILDFNPVSFIELKKLGDAKQSNRNRIMTGEYYFLDIIGISPSIARKGYGRLLIEPKLKQIAEQNMSCFVETSKVENVDYYKRYGFDLLSGYTYNGQQSFCLLKNAGI